MQKNLQSMAKRISELKLLEKSLAAEGPRGEQYLLLNQIARLKRFKYESMDYRQFKREITDVAKFIEGVQENIQNTLKERSMPQEAQAISTTHQLYAAIVDILCGYLTRNQQRVSKLKFVEEKKNKLCPICESSIQQSRINIVRKYIDQTWVSSLRRNPAQQEQDQALGNEQIERTVQFDQNNMDEDEYIKTVQRMLANKKAYAYKTSHTFTVLSQTFNIDLQKKCEIPDSMPCSDKYLKTAKDAMEYAMKMMGIEFKQEMNNHLVPVLMRLITKYTDGQHAKYNREFQSKEVQTHEFNEMKQLRIVEEKAELLHRNFYCKNNELQELKKQYKKLESYGQGCSEEQQLLMEKLQMDNKKLIDTIRKLEIEIVKVQEQVTKFQKQVSAFQDLEQRRKSSQGDSQLVCSNTLNALQQFAKANSLISEHQEEEQEESNSEGEQDDKDVILEKRYKVEIRKGEEDREQEKERLRLKMTKNISRFNLLNYNKKPKATVQSQQKQDKVQKVKIVRGGYSNERGSQLTKNENELGVKQNQNKSPAHQSIRNSLNPANNRGRQSSKNINFASVNALQSRVSNLNENKPQIQKQRLLKKRSSKTTQHTQKQSGIYSQVDTPIQGVHQDPFETPQQNMKHNQQNGNRKSNQQLFLSPRHRTQQSDQQHIPIQSHRLHLSQKPLEASPLQLLLNQSKPKVNETSVFESIRMSNDDEIEDQKDEILNTNPKLYPRSSSQYQSIQFMKSQSDSLAQGSFNRTIRKHGKMASDLQKYTNKLSNEPPTTVETIYSTPMVSQRQTKLYRLFNSRDLNELFGSVQQAYQFESSKTQVKIKLDNPTRILVNELYEHINILKKAHQGVYVWIKNFLKFPYQTAINNNTSSDLVVNYSKNMFQSSFGRMYNLHAKCPRLNGKVYCQHIRNFLTKIRYRQEDSEKGAVNLPSIDSKR